MRDMFYVKAHGVTFVSLMSGLFFFQSFSSRFFPLWNVIPRSLMYSQNFDSQYITTGVLSPPD